MAQENELHHIWDLELSDKEVFYIGKIVAQWGALEHEVFMQTIVTFDDCSKDEIELPKTMNNMRFTDVLEQWKGRVIDNKEEKCRAVLQEQYEKICHYLDYRNALVHGMWSWGTEELNVITTTRIRKKEIISTKFKSDDLIEFYTQIARINFNIRYPGGAEELYQEKASQGACISRRALSMLTNSDTADDWLPPLPGVPDEKSK